MVSEEGFVQQRNVFLQILFRFFKNPFFEIHKIKGMPVLNIF
jgi:hypothetical protein